MGSLAAYQQLKITEHRDEIDRLTEWITVQDALIYKQADSITKLEARNKYLENVFDAATSGSREALVKNVFDAATSGSREALVKAVQEWDAPHRGTETPPGKDAGA